MPDIRNISDVENTEKSENTEKTETEKKHSKSIKTIVKTIKSRALLIFYGLLIVSVLVVAVLFSVYTFFKIDKVNIEGSNLYTEEEILAVAGIKKGDSLWLSPFLLELMKRHLRVSNEQIALSGLITA